MRLTPEEVAEIIRPILEEDEKYVVNEFLEKKFDVTYLRQFLSRIRRALQAPWPTLAKLRQGSCAEVDSYCFDLFSLDSAISHFCSSMEHHFKYLVEGLETRGVQHETLAAVLDDGELSDSEKAAYILYPAASKSNSLISYTSNFIWQRPLVYKAVWPNRRVTDKDTDYSLMYPTDELNAGEFDDDIKKMRNWLEDTETQEELRHTLSKILEEYENSVKDWLPSLSEEIGQYEAKQSVIVANRLAGSSLNIRGHRAETATSSRKARKPGRKKDPAIQRRNRRILEYWENHPDAPWKEIGIKFNIGADAARKAVKSAMEMAERKGYRN